MNHSIIFFFICLVLSIKDITILASYDNKNSHSSEQEQLKKVAAIIFPEDMPTTSINEYHIDRIYGAQGLNLKQNDLNFIKKTYCYLEFLVKINKASADKKNIQYAADFKDFLQPRLDNLPLMPTKALVASKSWKSITITGQDIMQSLVWQLFVKTMLCDALDNNMHFITEKGSLNNQLFPYIPNIETAYQTQDYTKLRLYGESLTLQTYIQNIQQAKYQAQCTDWKTNDTKTLLENVAIFKKSDFYTGTHNAQSIKPSSGFKSIIIPSPLREQILCYFMILQIQMIMQNALNLSSIDTILKATNNSQVMPNFFTYNQSDLVLLKDLYTLQSMTDAHAAKPKTSVISMQEYVPSINIAPIPAHVSALITPEKKVPLPEDSQTQAIELVFNQIPTNSLYELTLDSIYGSSGLAIPPQELVHLKKMYCYLEFLVKLDKVDHNPSYSQYKKDFHTFINSTKEKQPLLPTQALVNSSVWKNITTTEEDIAESSTWQNFLKAMICDYKDNQSLFVVNSAATNSLIFPYLANIETGYETDDFTQDRLYLESIQLYQILENNQQNRCIQNCIDLKDKKLEDIDALLVTFKKTDFYTYTHGSQTSNKLPQSLDTIQEIIGYFMLITMQKTIYTMINFQNILSFLQKSSLLPSSINFFMYQSNDYIYLQDYLILIDRIADQKNHPKASGIVMAKTSSATHDRVVTQSYDTLQEDDAVLIQGLSIKDTFDPKKNGFNKSLKKTKKSFDKSNQSARDDLDPAKNGFNKSLEKTKKSFDKSNKALAKAFDPAKNGFNVAMRKMVKEIGVLSDGLATALIETAAGFAWLGYSMEHVTNPKVNVAKSTARAKDRMNAHKAEISASLGIIAIVTMTIVIGCMTGGAAAVLVGTLAIGADRADGRAHATLTKYIEKPMMEAMAPFLAGMEKMTDAFTQGFIDMSAGLTFMGASIGKGLGFKINPELEAEKTRANLERYRSTLNIVMSVVITFVMTVAIIICTAGAGAAYAAYLDAGFIGVEAGTIAAEGATLAGTAAEGALTAERGVAVGAEIVDVATAGSRGVLVASEVAEAPDTAALASRTVETADAIATGRGTTILSEIADGTSSTEGIFSRATATSQALTAEESIASDTLATESTSSIDLETADAQAQAAEKARLANRTVFQVAQEEGTWNGFWSGVYTKSFVIGQFLNAAATVFSAIGATNQDDAAAQELSNEEKLIQSLWKFIENSKLYLSELQKIFLGELHKKHQAEICNQALGLQYYTNFLNSSVNTLENQISQALAEQYIQLLTPDENEVRLADIGSPWGLKTAFNYLYPSQGFISTTLGRSNFPYAQEIAQAPLASQNSSTQTNTTILDKTQDAEKLWFNQRAITCLPQETKTPLHVEIAFRVLYTLPSSFHVGLYLGGNYHNYNSPDYLTSLNKEQSIDINEAHLAKMFVIKHDNQTSKPSLGIYEHEGKGWIDQKPIDPIIFNNAAIYHMSATLDQSTLKTSLWSQDNPAAVITQSVKVTPGDQRTFGIILSGAAVEWQVVTPKLSITENKNVRDSSSIITEIAREQASQASWQQLFTPAFGSMNLQAVKKYSIVLGQYIYTTKDTHLQDNKGNVCPDYVTFANYDRQVLSQIASNPTDTSASLVLVSLISGKIYNTQGTVIGQQNNVLSLFLQNNQPSDEVLELIKKTASNCQQNSTVSSPINNNTINNNNQSSMKINTTMQNISPSISQNNIALNTSINTKTPAVLPLNQSSMEINTTIENISPYFSENSIALNSPIDTTTPAALPSTAGNLPIQAANTTTQLQIATSQPETDTIAIDMSNLPSLGFSLF